MAAAGEIIATINQGRGEKTGKTDADSAEEEPEILKKSPKNGLFTSSSCDFVRFRRAFAVRRQFSPPRRGLQKRFHNYVGKYSEFSFSILCFFFYLP